MRILSCTFLALFIIACASETEQKSLEAVAEHYDATTSYSKSFYSSMGNTTTRKFNITVSDSELINSMNPGVTSRNIALMVFDNFTKKERDNYIAVEARLVNAQNDTATASYLLTYLERLSRKAAVHKLFSEHLVNGEYEKMDALRDTTFIKKTLSGRVEERMNIDKVLHGELVGYRIVGIGELKNRAGKLFQFHTYLDYSNGEAVPFIASIRDQEGRDEIVGFSFVRKNQL